MSGIGTKEKWLYFNIRIKVKSQYAYATSYDQCKLNLSICNLCILL